MTVVIDILPIFLVIALGFWGGRKGLFPAQFIAPANRLAFYLAIPALVFRAVGRAPLADAWQPLPALAGVAAQLITWLLALLAVRLTLARNSAPPASRASWLQATVHGNQAILGLAVVFYGLGEEGLSTAGLIVTAIILMQNLLSVVSFVRWGAGGSRQDSLVKSVLFNPIILAAMAGLAWSLTGWKLPAVLDRTLQILGNMGLPLALLIIGSNLAQGRLDRDWKGLLSLEAFKLLLMPALGLLLLTMLGVEHLALAVTVILLASPTATISVIMAGEMGGDSRLSSQAVTLSHALSAVTYSFWLWWLTG